MSNTAAANATLPGPASASIALTGNAAAAVATLTPVVGTAQALTGNGAAAAAILPNITSRAMASNNAWRRLNAKMPYPNAPFVDPKTGNINPAWYRLLIALFERTGGEIGTNTPTT